MQTAKQIITFPLKGLHTGSGNEFQPEGTTPQLRNVMPFDPGQAGKMRGGQRPGTVKSNSTQYGSGAPIRRLHTAVATTAGTTADTTSFSDSFGYSDGVIDTVSSGIWVSGRGTLAAAPSGVATTAVTATSNKLEFGLDASSASTAVRLVNTPVVGSVYTVKATVGPLPAAGVSLSVRLGVRWASFTADCVALSISRATLALVKNGTTYTSVTPGGTPYSGTNTFEVRVNGNSFSVYFNSVLTLGPTTITDYSGLSGFGISGDRADNSNGHPLVDDYQILTGSSRVQRVALVAGGNLYLGNDPFTALTLTSSGFLSASAVPTSADVDGKIIFADGVNTPKILDMSTDTLSTLAATAGVLPPTCKIAAVYRTRLLLANSDANPQNIYMSRAGTITDFDYSQTDAQAAVALNASATAGRIGQPVQCLVPFRDDSLLIGCDSSTFLMKGDPAEGGSVLVVSESVGIYGPNAATMDPEGNIYFVGNGGFYKLNPTPGSVPVNVSLGRVDSWFSAINRSTQTVTCVWDTTQQGCHIFAAYKNGTGSNYAGLYMWYDQTTDGFYQMSLPWQHGPQHAVFYRANSGDTAGVFLGGTDGYLRSFTASGDDDGTAISSYVWIGPIRPGGAESDSLLTGLEFYPAEAMEGLSQNLQFQVYVGADAAAALTSSAAFSGTLDQTVMGSSHARHQQVRQRLRGPTFFIKLFNATLNYSWTIEKIVATFRQGGKIR